LSPDLHRAAYQWLGLDWHYERHDVTADHVADFVAGLTGSWRGLSVTMPCKRAIVALGRPDAVTTALGVGNTVIFDGSPSDAATTRVHNTDVSGIALVLRDQGLDAASAIQVYGNGATARSCVYALAGLGVRRVVVRARDDGKTRQLAEAGADWGIEVVPGAGPADVVVSTVPAAVAGQWGADLGHPYLVFDVLYDPWPTPLAGLAAARGARVATGLDLLAAQAVGQVELMTGRTVDFAVLRRAADQGMASRIN